jgi:glycosyltransferase involved in cell wall biosynthesis
MSEGKVITVVVPLFEDSPLFRESLDSILKSDYPNFEVLVVDDSVNGIDAGGLASKVRVIRMEGGRGPAKARNIGALASRGDILVFIDYDVVIRCDTLSSLATAMDKENADGAIAIQSSEMRWKNFCSTYKNMFLHYSFIRLKERAPSFYTCCAMVKKSVFLPTGGFDERYLGPAIEDTDMGHKLAARGAKIIVENSVWVEHVKKYTLRELILLDFRRAASLIRLFLRRRCLVPNSSSTSVPISFIASGFFSIGMIISLILFIIFPVGHCAVLFFLFFAGVTLSNTGLIKDIWQSCGTARTVQTVVFLPVDLIVSVAGSFWGMIAFVFRKRY